MSKPFFFWIIDKNLFAYISQTLLYPLDASSGYFGLAFATLLCTEIFKVNALSRKSPASFTKIAGYLYWDVSFSGTEISLILKTRWPLRSFIVSPAFMLRGI